MPHDLPPLSSLRLFEAAGRHLSFKLAAAELHLTPSAVSHGILGLEKALGTDLFVRGSRGLSLTPAGADYLDCVAEALSRIAAGTRRLSSRQSRRAIAVSCAPTFASRWLLPRLKEFNRRRPDAAVTIDTSHRQVEFPADGFDFAVRMGRVPTAGMTCTRLFGERLTPVCSPAYRASLINAAGNPDLRNASLIHVTHAAEDWKSWLNGSGVADIELDGGLRFDTIQLAFEAAIAGLGVVLGRRPLVDRDLAAGTLVELGPAALAGETAYWLVGPQGAGRRPELRDFEDWLIGEAQAA